MSCSEDILHWPLRLHFRNANSKIEWLRISRQLTRALNSGRWVTALVTQPCNWPCLWSFSCVTKGWGCLLVLRQSRDWRCECRSWDAKGVIRAWAHGLQETHNLREAFRCRQLRKQQFSVHPPNSNEKAGASCHLDYTWIGTARPRYFS